MAHNPHTNPATNRLALFAASLAGPLGAVANYGIGLLLLFLGVIKLLPAGTVAAADHLAKSPASADLVLLASGGVLVSPWGLILVALVQVSLGLGLLVPTARAVAGLGCLFTAVAVAIGVCWHWAELNASDAGHGAALALLALFIVLLAGAALGTRSAARRLGLTT